jgi:hypothetical protein
MIKRNKITRNLQEEVDCAEKRFVDETKKIVQRLGEKLPVNFDGYKEGPFEYGILKFLTTDEFKKDCFDRYVNLGVLHFKRGVNRDSILKFELDGAFFEINTENSTSKRELHHWYDIFSVAVLLRNEVQIQKLIALLPYYQEKQAFDRFWVRSMDLITMCLGYKSYDDNVLNELRSIIGIGDVPYFTLTGVKAIKATNDDGAKIYLPVMELYYLAYHKDELGFNVLLKEYLLYKKEWLTKKKYNNGYDYWLDFRLLGCCAYAYDLGLRITIQSEYIPLGIYK